MCFGSTLSYPQTKFQPAPAPHEVQPALPTNAGTHNQRGFTLRRTLIGHFWVKKSGFAQEACFDAKATISAMNLQMCVTICIS